MMKKVLKTFIAALFILTGPYAFSQNNNPDSTIIQRYTFSENVQDNNAHKIFLVKVKNDGNNFRITFKHKILSNPQSNWFIVAAGEQELKQNNFFEKILAANNNYKLSPAFFQNKLLHTNDDYRFSIKVKDSLQFITYQNNKQLKIESVFRSNFFIVKTNLSFIRNILINDSNVTGINIIINKPKEEMVINDYDNSVNSIDLFFSEYSNITGDGLSASVKENLFDTNDIDFKNRYQYTPNISSTVTTHATTMSTLIAGGGNSFFTGKGIAPGTKLTSSDFANLLPDDKSLYQQYNTSVQNHSYGTAVENFYGPEANAFDQSLLDNQNLVYVFSAGNSGTDKPASGQYQNLQSFANITGNFKQAKNVIIVGSVDSFYNVPAASSKGPAYDGRIKPELVAYGNDGSSGAAAITSGTALAVQSAYAKQHHDSLPFNYLTKAILINSADDIFNAGPDYYSGFGNVNTYKAVRDINAGNFFLGEAKQNTTDSFVINVGNNIQNLKITLVWNDEPAQPNAATALVNDLDLQLKNKTSNSVWLPWVLNSTPDSATLLSTAQRKRDSLNNVEQVTLQNPGKGSYVIYVKGYDVTSATQPYCVVYEMDTANHFQFITPSSVDNFLPAKKGIVRWNSSYTNAKGKLEYSTDKGFTWKLISNNISLINKYFKWQVPDTSCLALMRMTISNDVYVSDTFGFCAQLSPKVILNCSDSVLLTWNKIKGISTYKVLQLGDKYLEQLMLTNDTNITIKNSASPYIAVAPVFENNRQGLNSYTFNFNTQGAGCYINNFLADLTPDNKADLSLTLGTTTNIDSVQFQHIVRSNWQNIITLSTITSTDVHYIFTGLQNGINIFRAIVWVDGNQIISDSAVIYYFSAVDFIVKPNPLPRGQNLTLLSSTLVTGTLVIYDVMGRKLTEQVIAYDTENTIITNNLAAGIYFLVMYDDSKQNVFRGKILIQ